MTINRGHPDYRVWFWVPAVLVTHDVSVLSGHLVGDFEWLTEPLYRRKYAEYMDPRTSQTGGA